MTSLIRIAGAALAGMILGMLFTARSLAPGRAGIVVGPWQSQPRDGSGEVDPYALAATARAGLLPLGAGEGLSFVAATDSAGATFDRACDYVVEGPMPSARYWTLSLLTPDGFPVADPAMRYAISSAEALRFNGEPVTIAIASGARSGNWLPTGEARTYVLMLRLYDTGLSTVGTTLTSADLPSIGKGPCR